MPTLTLGSVRIQYEEAGTGQTLIFLHGYACTSNDWAEGAQLLQHAFRVIRINFRNHGASGDLTQTVTLEDLVQDLYTILQHLNLKDAILIGHSMGGMIAMEFAIRWPSLIKALITVDSYTHLDTGGGIFGTAVYNDATPDSIRFEIKRTMDAGAARFDNSLMNSLKEWDVREKVQSIQIPTLTFFGDRYGTITEFDIPRVEQSLGFSMKSQKTTILIPDSHHFIQLEQPLHLIKEISLFLQKLDLYLDGNKDSSETFSNPKATKM
jgi:pimeloyl-ACP methyl ester carboxylesterase